MKLNVLSDLHLGFGAMERPLNDADVVVLAGDISRPREAVAWALRFEKPVLYVPGNHEYYGGSLDGVDEQLRRLCEGTQIHLLDRGELVIDGVRFLGAVLWTDFALALDPGQRTAAKEAATRLVRDFSRIRLHEQGSELFTPDHAAALFRRDAAWLESRLAQPHEGATVVITHHAPSRRSIHPRFADSPMNACFVSDAEYLIRPQRAALWIHGHTHDSFDYEVNGTRVLCNARGYARAGVPENALFQPDLVVEVG